MPEDSGVWLSDAMPPPKILVVDDEPINIRVLNEIFRADCEVYMANNGAYALERCRTILPDVVLLDVMMPGMDGHEVCRQLKADPVTKAIPIIFITAHFDEQEEVTGFELGAVDFIRKPINAVITRSRVMTHIKLKRQADLLRSIALKDGLTGVANRLKFDESLKNDWAQCVRESQPLSLIMLDVDFFKRYNDRYGHQSGDACLQAVASTIKRVLNRPYDLAARYGGEEFVCLLPNTNLMGAEKVADNILQEISRLAIPHEDSPENIVAVSIGVASVNPVIDAAPEDLLAAADEQLYQAKNTGRAQRKSIQLDAS